MVCVTYTAPVAPPPPPPSVVVSGLSILSIIGTTAVGIQWNQNIAGTVSLYVDSVFVRTVSGSAGYNQTGVQVGDTSINHQICVE